MPIIECFHYYNQGAAKKERPERRSKTAAKEEMMSIHSESQRMVRGR